MRGNRKFTTLKVQEVPARPSDKGFLLGRFFFFLYYIPTLSSFLIESMELFHWGDEPGTVDYGSLYLLLENIGKIYIV